MSERKQSAIKADSRGNWVAESLAKQVFLGAYRPGEMLPKETELVKELSVSRASVRSGLQTMASLGVIKRQVAHGTVVSDFREWNMLDPRISQWMVDYASPNPDFLQHIYEFRYSCEPYISAVAATRATARDLLAIETAFEGMENAVRSGTYLDFSRADIAFHTAIYQATHNLIWSQLAHILKPAVLLVIEESNATADGLGESLENHRVVMECIRLRQFSNAYDAAARVLDQTAVDLGLSRASADSGPLAMMKARAIMGEN